MKLVKRLLLLVLALTVGGFTGLGQAQQGFPPFASVSRGVNEANLNVHMTIPIFARAGRGSVPFHFSLEYDSTVWYKNGSAWARVPDQEIGFQSFGWNYGPQNIVGNLTRVASSCGGKQYWDNYAFHDPNGTSHSFGTSVYWSILCSWNADGTATDGSGYKIHLTGSTTGTVTAPDGTVYSTEVYTTSRNDTIRDTNGNYISTNPTTTGCAHPYLNYTCNLVIDTLGTQVMDISTYAQYPRYFTYTAPSGAAVAAVVSKVNYTVQTNFGCTGVTEYPATVNALVD